MFAALHGEAGNDMPLLLSSAQAERADGGWLISGHKIFGSLSPVWTYGGFHAMDTSDPAAPQIVHGFLPRDAEGFQIVDTWDTLGMRATQSQDTVLDKAFVPDELVPLVCPAGFAGAGLFHVAIFAWALMGFAAVYLGAARRAFDMTVERMPQRTSVALTRSMAHHPEVQHHVAEMRMAYDAAEALLERTTADWTSGVEHADWPVRLVGTRQIVINKAYEIVDTGARPVGRRGRVQAQPARADLPGRADGPLPPGQHDARPRADRQALPRHRPRRPAPLGLRSRPAAALPVSARRRINIWVAGTGGHAELGEQCVARGGGARCAGVVAVGEGGGDEDTVRRLRPVVDDERLVRGAAGGRGVTGGERQLAGPHGAPDEAPAESAPGGLDPLLVGDVGEARTPPQLERRLVLLPGEARGAPAVGLLGTGDELLELGGVDEQMRRTGEHHRRSVLAQQERRLTATPVRLEHTLQVGQRHAQVAVGGRRVEVGPQRVADGLATRRTVHDEVQAGASAPARAASPARCSLPSGAGWGRGHRPGSILGATGTAASSLRAPAPTLVVVGGEAQGVAGSATEARQQPRRELDACGHAVGVQPGGEHHRPRRRARP